jgi:DNA ligase-1
MSIVKSSIRPLFCVALKQSTMKRFLVSNKTPIEPAAAAMKSLTSDNLSSTIPDVLPSRSVEKKSKVEIISFTPAVTSNASAPSTSNSSNETFEQRLKSFPLSADLAKLVTWPITEPGPYSLVVATFEEIASKSGRLDKENILARLFRLIIATQPLDLEPVAYMAFNSVAPVYEGLELGVGDSLLVKAICEATGRKKEAVEEDYEREGDLGVVALASRSSQKTLSFAAKPKPLTAAYIRAQLREITQIKGDKAQGRKVEVIKSLLVKCQVSESPCPAHRIAF